MFGMLQYDSRKKDVQFIQKEDPSGMTQHSACDYCRHKKLRCSGDTTGCKRCKALSRSCAYTSASQVKTRGPRQMSKTLSSNPSSASQAVSPPMKENIFSPLDDETHNVQQLANSSIHQPQKPGTVSLGVTPGIADLESQSMQWDMDGLGPILDYDATFPQDLDIYSPVDLSMMPQYPQTPSLSHGSSRLAAPTSREERQCACIDTIVFLIEDIDGTISSVHKSPLDTSLAAGKGALASGRRLLHCQDCTTRTEILILLLFVCEKLVHLSTSIVEQFRKQIEAESWQAGKAQENRSVMVGDYEISSQREWSCLFRALVTLQLESLHEVLNELGHTSQSALPQSQHAKLAVHAEKVAQLRKQMMD